MENCAYLRKNPGYAPADITDHRSYAQHKQPEKNSGLNEIRTHDHRDTDAVLYELSYQANWELATS